LAQQHARGNQSYNNNRGKYQKSLHGCLSYLSA
jgi:hypothetical protein